MGDWTRRADQRFSGPLLLLLHSRQLGTLVNNAFLVGTIMEYACQIGIHRISAPELLVWNMHPQPSSPPAALMYAQLFWLSLAWHSQVCVGLRLDETSRVHPLHLPHPSPSSPPL